MDLSKKAEPDPSLETNDSSTPNKSITHPAENDQDATSEKNEDLFVKPDFINLKPLKKKAVSIVTSTKENEENISSEKCISLKVKSQKSPSQYIAEKEIPIPYKEPSWSGLPPCSYNFEVIKNGVVIENIPFNKPYLIVGRLSNCDVLMEHPSISRFHCVIQYRTEGSIDEPAGVYVYDMESTHGSFQNKHRLQPKKFNRVRVGHILTFGGSTRLFVLQGPDEDQEPESELTVTELITMANDKKLKLEKLESGELETKKEVNVSKQEEKHASSTEGIDWGMGEDAQEEDDDENGEEFKNPFASNEELYLNDPKKTLRGWFEREGYDLPDYQLEEIKPGHFRGRIELPALGSGGKPLVCVMEHKGKKKDTVVQCALEACRTLDRLGLLRQATHESHQKKKKDWSENDYYESDEDDFLDRTGDIERKRRLRKKESECAKGKSGDVETYDSLTKQYSEVIASLEKLEKNLKLVNDLKKEQEKISSDSSIFSDADELDAYMNHLSSQLPDKHKRIAWKLEVVQLQKEEVRLRKLINLARPLGIPELPERRSECFENKKESTRSFSRGSEASLKRKGQVNLKVHEAFLEEEEEVKPKLRKVNCDDDDDDDDHQAVRPVPYSKPQKTRDKYREMLNRDRRRQDAPAVPVSSFLEPKKVIETPSTQSTTSSTSTTVDIASESLLVDDGGGGNTDSFKGEDCSVEECDLESNSKKRVVGPSLPLPEKLLEFAKPRSCLPLTKEKSKEVEKLLKKKKKKNPFDFEKQYETWVPPKDQTGDGRTALNDKLGY